MQPANYLASARLYPRHRENQVDVQRSWPADKSDEVKAILTVESLILKPEVVYLPICGNGLE
jgi:hypothetical protein